MSKQKVLVVDDEPELLRSISRILTREGFDVSTANCAEDQTGRNDLLGVSGGCCR